MSNINPIIGRVTILSPAESVTDGQSDTNLWFCPGLLLAYFLAYLSSNRNRILCCNHHMYIISTYS